MSDNADVRILPPLIAAASLFVAVALGLVANDHLFAPSFANIVGGSFVALSIVLVTGAALELKRADTSFDVRKPTSAIVSSGVFSVTHNPVYLSMMLLYVGVALLVNSVWTLLCSVPTGSLLCFLAIKPEERYLEAKFGDTYRQYKARVRRWL